MRTVPNVPIIFPDKVPVGYVNDVQGWSSSHADMSIEPRKLLTLDIDFGERCSLNCPMCFRKDGTINTSGKPILTYDETMRFIAQAKDLGLQSVKILGAGEPFEDRRFLQFLREMNMLGIYVSIFTKGHVLGNDEMAKRYFGKLEGIQNCESLVRAIAELKVSILLSFQSFDTRLQDSLVQMNGHTSRRNRAIELLCQHGFNRSNPTRLAIAIIPVTKETISEVFEIYCWGRERNMYPIVCPSMCSGRASDEEYRKVITPSNEELFDLYERIYRYNIAKGIQTLQQLRAEGVSAYAGSAPCTQVRCGMYVTSRGLVLRCPGDDVTIFGDVREESLKSIWQRSENFSRQSFNCRCPPKDGKTIPPQLYDVVLERISR